MTYTVVWLPSALDELAHLWNTATDRAAVAAASDRLDAELAKDPYTDSRVRKSGDRAKHAQPLYVAYTVSDPDRLVTVWAVWRVDDTNGSVV